MTETERERVVRIAHSYLRTPYHPHGRVKGVGVDCLTILECVFREAALVLNADIPHYSPEFMCHSSEERYMTGLLRYTREVDTPEPGDIALWKFGRCFSHAAIVVKWPLVIHAYVGGTVRLEDVEKAVWLSKLGMGQRPVKFFSYWGGMNGLPKK